MFSPLSACIKSIVQSLSVSLSEVDVCMEDPKEKLFSGLPKGKGFLLFFILHDYVSLSDRFPLSDGRVKCVFPLNPSEGSHPSSFVFVGPTLNSQWSLFTTASSVHSPPSVTEAGQIIPMEKWETEKIVKENCVFFFLSRG